MTDEEQRLIENLEKLVPSFNERISFLCSYMIMDAISHEVLPLQFNEGMELTKKQYNKHFQEFWERVRKK